MTKKIKFCFFVIGLIYGTVALIVRLRNKIVNLTIVNCIIKPTDCKIFKSWER